MAQEAGLITVAEAAAALRVSDETVHRWCRSGRLEFVRISPRVKRFRRAYIDELVAKGTRPAKITEQVS